MHGVDFQTLPTEKEAFYESIVVQCSAGMHRVGAKAKPRCELGASIARNGSTFAR